MLIRGDYQLHFYVQCTCWRSVGMVVHQQTPDYPIRRRFITALSQNSKRQLGATLAVKHQCAFYRG